ncbi:MAG: D-glycero-beta-D-manno-heptose-7-phosphate kinase [Chlamydiales bacterium]|nr:D-glycero-beta-D-manno-heptose-7-phosphate kinase [Chlamydiales bacterium]
MVKFDSKRILVAGDFMLDVYTIGDVQRISPEAPVPVLRVVDESRRPGGAGNAILNLVSLGMEVVALGRVGRDEAGSHFIESLAKEGVDISAIESDPDCRTPLKNRMIAAGQQLVRIDYESPAPLSAPLEQKITEALPTLLKGIDVVALSDYAKGFLTPSLLSELIDLARAYKIPVIVDPKGRDFLRYRGATLLKPNLSEAIEAAGLGAEATLDEVAHQILDEVALETLMITRSKEGISIFDGSTRKDFPARVHEIKDVTGAGDTVLALVTVALANGMNLADAAELANIAAGIAIERVGCARITLADLAARLQLS